MDSQGGETDGTGQAPAVESLGESFALLARRAVFVAVALVQIGVELAVSVVRQPRKL